MAWFKPSHFASFSMVYSLFIFFLANLVVALKWPIKGTKKTRSMAGFLIVIYLQI